MAKVDEQVADRLYAAEPQQFVAARDEAVAQARASGDNAAAAAIAKLRKPTVAAWLVNLLALKRPQLISELLELGEHLREAQRRLSGEQLRKLAGQRRAVIASLVGQAQALAVEAQPDLHRAKLPVTEVESTLTAALADDNVAAQVRAGRLVKTVSYAGFGEAPAPGAKPQPAEREERPAGKKVTPQMRQRVTDARKAEAAARKDLEQAEAAERDAAGRLAGIEEEIGKLEERRERAREELSRGRAEHKAAQRALTAAGRKVAEAEADLEE